VRFAKVLVFNLRVPGAHAFRVGRFGGLVHNQCEVTEGIDEFTGKSGKKYVGQSGNIPRRLGEHARLGKLPDGNTVSTTEVLGGKTAREIAEQKRIDALGGTKGGNVENKINPIGLRRQHLLRGGK
jgi:hypothetical protein